MIAHLKKFTRAEDGTLVAEASSLGLQPGQVPSRLIITSEEGELYFSYHEPDTHRGKLVGFRYREQENRSGRALLIND